MNQEQFLKNLEVPQHPIDVILDTDAYNEIDDQFAIAYIVRSSEKLNVKAIYAAPFYNDKSTGPEDGMEKSYQEIQKVLRLTEKETEVFKGSSGYLPDEKTFVDSPAARDLAARAMRYSPEQPLYVVAIGAITNIASALLLNPDIAEKIVIVWLGGHARHHHNTREFNMYQDIAAARVVMGSAAPFVQLPCTGVVSEFRISAPEIKAWLCGKGKLADYLANITISEGDRWSKSEIWTRVIWDVTAVAWLLNDNSRFMEYRVVKTKLPTYENLYSEVSEEKMMGYVYCIKRDALMRDLIEKLTRS